MLAKVIKDNDHVVWSNGKYNQKMTICRVVDTTNEKVVLLLPNKATTRVYPKHLVVITQQVHYNLENNVGSNLL